VFAVAVLAAAALAQEPLRSISSGFGGRMPCGACRIPPKLSNVGTVAPRGEPGQALVIKGRAYEADGRTPAEGVVLFVYQTDASGHYNRQDDPFQPRLRAWLRTGPGGEYEIRTIRPGPYPDHSEPAHLHVHAFGPDRPERFLGDLWFADDPLVNPNVLAHSDREGAFGLVLRPVKLMDGTLQAEHDLRLPPRPK
jgi:protocatechuate 3,4-dioxygenase beta subunit